MMMHGACLLKLASNLIVQASLRYSRAEIEKTSACLQTCSLPYLGLSYSRDGGRLEKEDVGLARDVQLMKH